MLHSRLSKLVNLIKDPLFANWTLKIFRIFFEKKSVKPVVWVVPDAVKTEKTVRTGPETSQLIVTTNKMRLDGCAFVENNLSAWMLGCGAG